MVFTDKMAAVGIFDKMRILLFLNYEDNDS